MKKWILRIMAIYRRAFVQTKNLSWIPAFAGMTKKRDSVLMDWEDYQDLQLSARAKVAAAEGTIGTEKSRALMKRMK